MAEHHDPRAILSSNERLVQGWVELPSGLWEPGDLILKPTAKSMPVAVGAVVDVEPFDSHAWVQAQIARNDKYIEYIKARIRAGTLTLTAALRRYLGWDGDAVELREEPTAIEAELAMQRLRRELLIGGGVH